MMTPPERWSRRGALAALAVLLLVGVPLFLCMPVCCDVVHFDTAAWTILHGGVYYRDHADWNLPGMVLIHVGVRSLFGWRSEVLRLNDLVVVAGSIGLLVGWLRHLEVGAAGRVWAAALLFLFYLSTSEWVHCQRDVWMLLPALVALHLRRRQVERLRDGAPLLVPAFSWAALEGLCWGGAVWIKPFVLFPAFACWLASAFFIYRTAGPRRALALGVDAGGLLLGGLLAGAVGFTWLWTSGSWPYFWGTFFHNNATYVTNSRALTLPVRLERLGDFLRPWGLLYLLTVPVTLVVLVRGLGWAGGFPGFAPQRTAALVLLAAVFAGWFCQAAFVQMQPHEYVLAPVVLLSLTVAVGANWAPQLARFRCLALLVLVVLALPLHPLGRPDRLALWGRCWAEGGSPDLKNRLTLLEHLWAPNWVELERVADYLRQQGVNDRELVCFNTSSMPLYLAVQVQPPTRAPHYDHVFNPADLEPLRQELNAVPTRFVVSDLVCLRHPPEVDGSAEDPDELSLPSWLPRRWAEAYPWCEPVVFRAGRYRVHRVTGPVRELKCSLVSFFEKPEVEENERAGGPEPLAPRTP
jgi:hypothetical protein